ncbi:hypothetical protein [Amycolatopsis sp. EV170708-02-1]|uniref:hypothetical protein n=1 Tax=Amycolatopsis sp. EV170708-02-1 TaxID=2919322 RepID=UPI001F0C6E26|nr:hypothetical protein [Amycolatopsis sp. EV170708-02-1]UMP06787.1 hypothetical protein MJQ72_19120 [Amycolatopsis sp. EV170708-02-1]
MATRQRAEATSKPASPGAALAVMWRGTRFTLPSPQEYPLEALEAEEEGKHLTALKLISRRRSVPRLARLGRHGCGRRVVLGRRDEGAGAGKPITVAAILGNEATGIRVKDSFPRLSRGKESFTR